MASAASPAALAAQKQGFFCCHAVDGDDASARRLKRLGVCEGQRIELVQAGDPMIIRVAGARVGLSRHLASRVLVEFVASAASETTSEQSIAKA